jgi:hypothetical protein
MFFEHLVMMKPVLLQFETLSDLAAFSKSVNDRGYVAIVKDLTLQINLTDAEQQVALQQHGARLLPFNRVAA